MEHSISHQPNWNPEPHPDNFSGDFHHPHPHPQQHHHQQQQHQHHHQEPPPPYHHHHQNQNHLEPPPPHQPNSFVEPNSSVSGEGVDSNPKHSLPFWPRKRQFSSDGGSYVKLYAVGVPRTTTEEDIRSVFAAHGHIVEVVLLRDKRTGQQQESCFVKYATQEEADRAIEALSGRYTFPGALLTLKVRYADGERERLGSFSAANVGNVGHIKKLYVGGLHKLVAKWEIDEVFSPFGDLEDVFIVRNELKQSRGYAFIRFSRREMAVAAINALNGTHVMRGCEQPLIVRFADPKKPKTGDFMPRPFTNGPLGGHVLPNNSNPLSQQGKSSSQSPHSRPQTALFGCPTDQVLPQSASVTGVSCAAETDGSLDCDWSEHICPDGDAYYYNCITCESRWEKPEEYAIYEQQLEKLEQQQSNSRLQN